MQTGILLFLDSISGGELILVFIVFLMLFGSKNIPDVARSLGKAMRQFKEATGEIQRDIEQSSRQLKNQIEAETRDIRKGLDVDVMAPNAPQPGERLSEEDRLANASTPPPAGKPFVAPSYYPPAPEEAPVDVPVNPSEEKPTA